MDGLERRFAPCIVFIYYYEGSGIVNDSHDVALQVMKVGVHRAVELHLCRTALCIVEEVQLILVCRFVEIRGVHRLVSEQFTVVSIHSENITGLSIPMRQKIPYQNCIKS